MQTVQPVVVSINKVVVNFKKPASTISEVITGPKYQFYSKLSYENEIDDLAKNLKKTFPNSCFYNIPEHSSTAKEKMPDGMIKNFDVEVKNDTESKMCKFEESIKKEFKEFLQAQNICGPDIKIIQSFYFRDKKFFEHLNLKKETLETLSQVFFVYADNELRGTKEVPKLEYTLIASGEKDKKNQLMVQYPSLYNGYTEMSIFFKNLASRTQ